MPEVQDNRVKIRPTRPSHTREQRAGFFLVVASGSLAIILGIVYLFDHISDPFFIDYEGPRFVTSQEQSQQEILALQQRDTDGDLLSDYDEIYVFGTSPYLADTDGDGYDDYAELQAGTDPTCAAGAQCTDEYEIFGIDQDQVAAYLDSLASSGEAVSDINALLQSFTSADIRLLLIEAGISEEQLAQISDEDLEALYESVLGDLQSSGEIESLVEQTLEQNQ